MRRKDREISDKQEILKIMKKCDVCRVAFFNDRYPYIVPMNFGVVLEEDKFKLYFHGANAGTKLELMRKNPNAAFEMDCSHRLLLGEAACDSTMEYESVCGNGVMKALPEEEKAAALQILMNQYQEGKKHEFGYNDLMAIEVLELTVDEISGKRLKRKPESETEEIGTLSCAKKYAEEGRIDQWLQKFLNGQGMNKALASGLLHEKRYYLGPVKMKMELFTIPEGAPNYLTKDNDIEWFFQVADRMLTAIKNGWDMPPLIVSYDKEEGYIPTDGRHRFEALRKLGAVEADAIIWTSSEEDYEQLLRESRIKHI
jgi:nitroimidazol reductase NimA-like FMN-containing flavoprotein (pyridoxamine 5'-phosphate oxidase superfamily)